MSRTAVITISVQTEFSDRPYEYQYRLGESGELEHNREAPDIWTEISVLTPVGRAIKDTLKGIQEGY